MGSQFAPRSIAPASVPVFQISPVETIVSPESGTTIDYLDYNAFRARVDTMPAHARLHMGGNADPLLHLHFFQMVRYAVDRGMHVSAASYLTVFPEYLAEECVRSGLHAMHVLLNAASASTYREAHGKDCFHKVMRNIDRLMRAKAAAQTDVPAIYLNCTALPSNLSQLSQLVLLAHEESFDGMQVSLSADDKLWQEERQRAEFHFKRAYIMASRLGLALDLPKLPEAPAKENSPWNKGRSYQPYPLWAG